MPPELQEKTPGVYVRAENELPHELDMLWSGNRPYPREERSPVISFVAGLLVGVVLTTAVFMLFLNKPKIETGATHEALTPIGEEVQTGPAQPASTVKQTGGKHQPAQPAASMGATTYTVVSGDSLGRIAQKVYGSSAPEYIQKIQRANNMKSPDSLQIDQKLVIPPKNY